MAGHVLPEEKVVVAIFESTDRDGNRLKPTAFPTKQLTRHEFSSARLSYISEKDFLRLVVEPLISKMGPLVGVVAARVQKIREIVYDANAQSRRAICVTDKVTADDYDAHAALGFAENQQDLTDKQKMNIRATIRANLADVFGELVSITQLFDRPPQ